MERLRADLRYAARLLGRAPGATAAIVISLALGIGANTTLFTWLSAVMLEPFPGVADPQRLVALHPTDPNEGYTSFSYLDYRDCRDNAQALSGVIAFDDQAFSLAADGQAERVWGLLVSGNYFDVVGVKPALGRTFRADEDLAPGRDAVVVLSHNLWQRRFAGDPGVVGRTVHINTRSFTVIGVTPPDFRGTWLGLAYDAYVPLAMQAQVMASGDRLSERGDRWLRAMGRLAPGVSRGQAQAELSTIAARLAREYHTEGAPREVAVFPVWNSPQGGGRLLTPVLLVLFVVSALVLLIACANVANLMLARATARGREVAVRVSLGASRGRLVRQLLTESVLLALLGGGAGVLVALWCSPLLRAFVPPTDFPIDLAVRLDGRALLFTVALSLVTGLLFGLAPALHASRPALASVLRDEAGSVAGRRGRLRHGLVVAQVALSMVLLVGAGLFLRSLRQAQAFDPGFRPDGVLLASFDLFAAGYDEARGVAFQERLLERVGALPGVTAVTTARRIPLSFGGSSSINGLRIDGYTPPPNEQVWSYVNLVGPDYFRTLGVPLVRGRDVARQDAPGAPLTVVINETMARRYWPGRDALGGRITFDDEVHTVVGVARDFTFRRLGEPPAPYMFVPIAQDFPGGAVLHLRVAGDPLDLAPALQEVVRSMDAALPLFGVRTLEQTATAATFQHRLAGTLLGAFGALALVLATVGLGGVLAYMVGQRTREIGVRMALGGDRGSVFRLILRRGLGLTALGMALGLGAALLAMRPLGRLLFGVSPGDPLTLAGVALLLGSAAFLACFFPARRAMRVDPLAALRHE